MAASDGLITLQRDLFIKTARILVANEDETAFKAKLAAITRQKPRSETELDKGGE